jgi:hypothetical protein
MVNNIWGLLVIYQLKHLCADYFFQGRYMLGKFRDHGWVLPLLAHVAVHGAMTFGIAVLAGKWQLALPLMLFDSTVHFIMDRIKAGKKYLGRFKALSANEYIQNTVLARGNPDAQVWAKKEIKSNIFFWFSLGFDQMIHHLTHYTCIAALLLIQV